MRTILVLLACVGTAFAADYPIQLRATAMPTADTGTQEIVVQLAIAEGASVIANDPVPEGFERSATKIVLTTPSGKKVRAKIRYPKGKLIQDEIVGDYAIYTGTVTIRATVFRENPNESLLVRCVPRGMHSPGR